MMHARSRLLTSSLSFWLVVGAVAPVLAQETSKPARLLPAPSAQDASPEELRHRRDQKLKKPVFGLTAWRTDVDAACQEAKQTGKLVLVYFTRSYEHCGPCENLEGSLFATAAFAEWSKNVVLLLHVTSRVTGDPHQELPQRTGANGFPTVAMLDADGRRLVQVGHVVTLEQCERALADLRVWQALRREVEAGDAGAAKTKQLFWRELAMGNRPFAEMQQRRAALTLPPAELATTEQAMVNLEFAEILHHTRPDEQAHAGQQCLSMWRAGRVPDGSGETSFWQFQLAWATQQKDVPLFKELLAWLRAHRAGDRRFGRYLRQLEQQLAQLEQQKGG